MTDQRRRLEELLAEVRRELAALRELELKIAAKLFEQWQDNDAPEAEEVTKTSLSSTVAVAIA